MEPQEGCSDRCKEGFDGVFGALLLAEAIQSKPERASLHNPVRSASF